MAQRKRNAMHRSRGNTGSSGLPFLLLLLVVAGALAGGLAWAHDFGGGTGPGPGPGPPPPCPDCCGGGGGGGCSGGGSNCGNGGDPVNAWDGALRQLTLDLSIEGS